MRGRATLLAVVLARGAIVMFGTLGTALAATPPAAAPTAPTAPMAPRAPSATSPTDTPVARQPSLRTCNKQADAKSLTGKERATFVKDCLAGRTSPED